MASLVFFDNFESSILVCNSVVLSGQNGIGINLCAQYAYNRRVKTSYEYYIFIFWHYFKSVFGIASQFKDCYIFDPNMYKMAGKLRFIMFHEIFFSWF